MIKNYCPFQDKEALVKGENADASASVAMSDVDIELEIESR
jgi:hypothetical protein